jgi:hypothetical protein
MIRQLARDESGITMGLTVIMIVLIGVMGAGLLTFVQNDLGTVIESNQGHTPLSTSRTPGPRLRRGTCSWTRTSSATTAAPPRAAGSPRGPACPTPTTCAPPTRERLWSSARAPR